MPLVGLVMGSASDEHLIQDTIKTLEQMKIDYEVRALSAHRTPERVREYALSARERGIEVFIAAAGGSAALGGTLAAWTTLPVIGIPLTSSDLNGIDSLLSTAQMPPGIPCGLRGHRQLGGAQRGLLGGADPGPKIRRNQAGI